MEKNKFNRQSLGLILCFVFAIVAFVAEHVFLKTGGFLSIASLPIAGTFVNRRQLNSGAAGEGGAAEENPEAIALLAKIKDNVKNEIETRGYQNKESIEALISTALTGLNLEALRSFDSAKLEGSVRNMAGELEKVKQAGNPLEMREAKMAFRSILKKPETWKLIERAFDKTNPQTVVLNTRAAAMIMSLQDTIDNYETPDDLIESFSVDGFIKKRRPYEYIFDVASRRTVATITEYKTWLEEGDESGAFALVGEGLVKPLVSKTLVRNTNKYKKVAGKRVYTEEFAMFRKEAYGIFEDLFNEQLIRNYKSILTTELLAKAASYVGTVLDNQYTAPTDYHAIGAVAAQIETLEFYPDILVINPQDKWRISLEQNSVGTFFLNIPQYSPDGTVVMLGFPVITSTKVPVGYGILGEAKLYKIEDMPVITRMGYGIDVAKNGEGVVTDVSSDLDNNRFRIISEFFFHSYIGTNNLGSFVYFNFEAVKEALTAPVSP